MRTKHLVPGLLALVFAFVPTASAVAQEQTGSIAGVVRDASGAVLPGVIVEARSPQMVGVGKAVADADGQYRFPALPAGTYSVTATRSEFNPQTMRAIVVEPGQLLKVDVVLPIAGVTETVQVQGHAPVLDIRQNTSVDTIEDEVIQRIPKGRDFTSLVRIAPGVEDETLSGGIQIDGASGAENRFIIDGLDTTDLLLGTSGKTMLVDFVSQVQVTSSGYNAEYGSGTGGAISAITKSGSNNLHGGANLHYQSNALYGARRSVSRYWPWATDTPTPERGLLYPDTPWTYLSPTVDLGGPILRDRLWYYAGYGLTNNAYERDAIFYRDPSKTTRHFEWWNRAHVLNYNVTTRVTNSVRLRLGGSNERSGNRNAAPSLEPDNSRFPDGTSSRGYTTATFDKKKDGTIDQAAYDKRWNQQGGNGSNDTYSANVDWVIGPRLFVNAVGGYFRTNYWTPAAFRGDQIERSFVYSNAGMAGVPTQFQQPAGYVDNKDNYGTARDLYSRLYVNSAATWFQSWAGQHMFKAGLRFERLSNDVLKGDTRPNISLYWGKRYVTRDGRVVQGTFGYYTVRQIAFMGEVQSNNVSLWLQDSWTIKDRLTINAGVRSEHEHIPSYKKTPGAADITFGFAEKIAPRVGFAYDVKGDGKWKIYGSYGWFYDITKLELARELFGSNHWVDYYWTLDTYDWSSINCGEGTTGCPGTFIEQLDVRPSTNEVDPILEAYFNRPGMTGVDPNLRPMKTGEVAVGADHELGPTLSVGVRYVHKWLARAIEDVGMSSPDYGTDYVLGNPGFGYTGVMNPEYPQFPTPRAVRDYDGVELRVRKRFAKRWSMEANYLYSRLWGNYGGLASSDEEGRVSPNLEGYFDAPYVSYDANGQPVIGLLPTDRPHRLKLQATYDFRWGTSVGVFGIVQSGTVQTSQIQWQGYAVYFNGRGDLGRTPVLSQIDLQIGQDFRLGGSRRLSLLANVSNLFDQNTVIAYYTNPYRQSFDLSDSVFFGGPWNVTKLAADLRTALGGFGFPGNAFYMEPRSYQSRRAVRFQARFSF